MSSDNLFAQHLPSNIRTFTDHYLVNASPYYSHERNCTEIIDLKKKYDFIEIPDETLVQVREEYNNSISFGDALSIILAKKFKKYMGLLNTNEDELTQHNVNDDGIITSFYDESDKKTYYFIQNKGNKNGEGRL